MLKLPFKAQRLIFLTPGLVELGSSSWQIHYQIGQMLAEAQIDLVLLIENQSTKAIVEGMLSQTSNSESYTVCFWPKNKKEVINQTSKQIVFFRHVQLAHEALAEILRPKDVILFQNDWTDNYLV